MSTTDPNAHIILYAKNWYKRGNMLNDLKIIIGKKCGMTPDCICEEDIVTTLLKVSVDHVLTDGDTGEKMFGFVLDLHPVNRWRFGCDKEENFNMILIRKCLSVLMLSKPKENLGMPDPSILPINNPDKLGILKNKQ